MKKKAHRFLVLSIVMALFAIFGLLNRVSNVGFSGSDDLVVTLLVFGLFLWLGITFFRKYKKYSDTEYLKKEKEKYEQKLEVKKKRNEEKIEKLKKIPGTKYRNEELGASLSIYAKHMAGLPLAEDTPCYLYLCKDKVIFERNENVYNLTEDKIIDVIIKTDKDIQKSYVSSIGGAIGGNMLFGPLGAMVGGRAKEKKSTTINNYLIFTYNKGDNVDYISFDVTKVLHGAMKFVNFFQKKEKESKEINL